MCDWKYNENVSVSFPFCLSRWEAPLPDCTLINHCCNVVRLIQRAAWLASGSKHEANTQYTVGGQCSIFQALIAAPVHAISRTIDLGVRMRPNSRALMLCTEFDEELLGFLCRSTLLNRSRSSFQSEMAGKFHRQKVTLN